MLMAGASGSAGLLELTHGSGIGFGRDWVTPATSRYGLRRIKVSTELAVPQQGGMVHAGFTREQRELIKRTVAQKATDDELSMFVELCSRRGLDPFTRQVYFWKTSDGKVTIATSIDGLRCIADRSEKYVPGDTTYNEDRNGNVISATVSLKRLVAGQWHIISETAYLSEYKQNTPLWSKMPRVMLAKCAEARALRRAFPEDISGLYAQEEMPPVDMSTGEVIEATVEPPKALADESKKNETIRKLIAAFLDKGIQLKTLEGYIGRPADEWQSPEIEIMRTCYKLLKSGEKTVEELFATKVEAEEL